MKRWIIGLLVLSVVAIGNAWGAVEYTVTDLGSLAGNFGSVPYGINDNGQVVGYALTNYVAGGVVNRAFLYSGGSMQDIGSFASQLGSMAYGINASGQGRRLCRFLSKRLRESLSLQQRLHAKPRHTWWTGQYRQCHQQRWSGRGVGEYKQR